jgi:hypothetical protein
MDTLRLYRVRQQLLAPRVTDLAAAVRREVRSLGLPAALPPGARIAVTAGSRGITGIVTVLSTIVSELLAAGFAPFIVPSMGSHGGATAEGQTDTLARLGITPEAIGAPIRSSMDVVEVGRDGNGDPVFVDRIAWTESDGILVVNRIKPHTDFTGSLASGLLKMLVVGLGKREGALAAHRRTLSRGYMGVLPHLARVILAGGKVVGGIALVENHSEQTALVQAVRPDDLEAADTRLSTMASDLLGRLPVEAADVLVVDWAGKEISGNGMDPNVIGRRMFVGEPELSTPRIRRVFLRDLTLETHGNALGIGLADFCTRRAAERVDWRTTYLNAITAMTPEKARLPVVCESDREGLAWSILTGCPSEDATAARVIWIKNTRDLEVLYVSAALVGEVAARPGALVDPHPVEVAFDRAGAVIPFWSEDDALTSSRRDPL